MIPGVHSTACIWRRLAVLSLTMCWGAFHVSGREIRFLAWDDDVASREFALVAGERFQSLEGLHPLQRSEPLVLEPEEEGAGWRYLVEGDEERWMRDRELPDYPRLRLLIPENFLNPLVLLIPDGGTPLGVRALVLEDARDEFDWGRFRILNTTPSPLVLLSRGQRVDLPAEWSPVDFELSGNRNEPVVIGLEDPQQGFTLIYSTIWMPDPETRRLVFIVPSENTRLGYVSLKIITEFRQSVPEAEPTLDPGE